MNEKFFKKFACYIKIFVFKKSITVSNTLDSRNILITLFDESLLTVLPRE